MATGKYKRKLAAILHADVTGYSRLMGDDEKATLLCNLLRATVIGFSVLIIGAPACLFALGELDGVWIGEETLSILGQQERLTVPLLLFQEDDSTLYVYDELAGNIRLVKSGAQWILPDPVEVTYMGDRFVVNEVVYTFSDNSRLTGTMDITAYIGGEEYAANVSLDLYKESCQPLSNGTTLPNLSGAVDSLRCFEIEFQSGTTNLNVLTWGGSGDCDLGVVYYRPDFDIYYSESYSNEEEITIKAPHAGKWYIALYGFENYAGVSLRVGYDESAIPAAEFTATPSIGFAPLQVQFTDTSQGDVTGWLWDFGDGSTSSAQSPTHLYTDSGTYSVSLTAMGPEGSDTETKADYIRAALVGADIDNNGSVDLIDAILALQVLANLQPSSLVPRETDVNGDGKTGLDEAIYILQWVSEVR